jgi:hypothetical protein
LRTHPLMGTKPWFAPRRFGWGLGPVSAEGWAVVAAALGLSGLARRRGQRGLEPLLGLAVVLIAALKGTSPGGPRARRAYEAARNHP